MHACNYKAVPQSDSVGVMDPEQTPANQQGAFSLLHVMTRGGVPLPDAGAEGIGVLRWRCRLGSLTMIRGWNKTRRPYLSESSTCLESSEARWPRSTSVIFTVSEHRLPGGGSGFQAPCRPCCCSTSASFMLLIAFVLC